MAAGRIKGLREALTRAGCSGQINPLRPALSRVTRTSTSANYCNISARCDNGPSGDPGAASL